MRSDPRKKQRELNARAGWARGLTRPPDPCDAPQTPWRFLALALPEAVLVPVIDWNPKTWEDCNGAAGRAGPPRESLSRERR